MKKISYPVIDFHDQSPDGDSPGVEQESQEYDSLSMSGGRAASAGSAGGDEMNPSPPVGYEDGVVFPIDEGTESLDEYLMASDELMDVVGGLILTVENNELDDERLSSNGSDVVSIRQGRSYRDTPGVCNKKGDVRFFNFNTKFDGVIFPRGFRNSNDCKMALENIYSQMKPTSCGIVNCQDDSLIRSSGFEVGKRIGKFAMIKRSDVKKTTMVNVMSSAGSRVLFSCDVASTAKEQSIGLQSYRGLSENAGLLFKYDKPTDVTFHMGTVGFPIDIIFVNGDGLVKKIVANAAPGTLDLFACSQVENVLEINGGLASEVGISVGDSVFVGSSPDRSESIAIKVAQAHGIRGLVIKNASESSEKVIKFGSGNLVRISSKSTSMNIYRAMTKVAEADQRVVVFDIDSMMFSEDSTIRVYSGRRVSSEDEHIGRDIDNNSFALATRAGKVVHCDIPASVAANKSLWAALGAGKRLAIGVNRSFDNFMDGRKSEHTKEIAKALAAGDKVVVATRNINADRDILSSIIHSKIASAHPNSRQKSVVEIMHIPANFYGDDIIVSAKQKYSTNNVIHKFPIFKTAGVPVPNATKETARGADKKFESAGKSLVEVIDSIKKNLVAYEGIQDDNERVKNSKGQYNESTKRISRSIKKMLIDLSEGIKIMNSIKDISTTSEIIHNLAISSQAASDSIKEIFNLINKIDSDTFIQELGELTSVGERTLGDLKLTIERMRKYISSKILGVLVLSD